MIVKPDSVIAAVAKATTDDEKAALVKWLEQLLEIRASAVTPAKKLDQALRLTSASAVVQPTLKILWRELKKHGWDDRGFAFRFGIVGAAVGLAVFGTQGAGIAALGTAVGVPLWVVLGGGAAWAGTMVKAFTEKSQR